MCLGHFSHHSTDSALGKWSARVMLLYFQPIHRSLITDHHWGGVAERLIAPVLKTGRPKGLVSSNLTPSAVSIIPIRTFFRTLPLFERPNGSQSVATDQS